MVDIDIASLIKAKQKERGVTQKQIADYAGITVAGFQKMLKVNDFKVSVLMKIAYFLETPVLYFFPDHDLIDFLKRTSTLDKSTIEHLEQIDFLTREKVRLESENETYKILLDDKDKLSELYKEKTELILDNIESIYEEVYEIGRDNNINLEDIVKKTPYYNMLSHFYMRR